MTTLDAALRHARHGRPVFPCSAASKRPITAHGFKDATTNPDTIRGWFASEPHLLALPTGRASGLVVLDIDGHQGADSLADLEREHGRLPVTTSVKTPRGQHYYFVHPGIPVRCSAGQIAPGVDVRGDGGYAIVPPSVMANGQRYEVDERRAPDAMPLWLTAATTQRDGRTPAAPVEEWLRIVTDGVDGPQNGRSGSRNVQMTRLVGHLLARDVNAHLVHELAQLVNQTRFRPPLEQGTVTSIVESICGRELAKRKASRR